MQIKQLTDDALAECFNNLDIYSLLSAERVCARWLAISQIVWNLRKSIAIDESNFQNSRFFRTGVNNANICSKFADFAEAVLSRSSNQLRHLAISGRTIRQSSMRRFAEQVPAIESLELDLSCIELDLIDEIVADRSGIYGFARDCLRLRTLRLRNFDTSHSYEVAEACQFTPRQDLFFLEAMPTLEQLEVSNLPNLSFILFKESFQNLSNLACLAITGEFPIVSEDNFIEGLRTLVALKELVIHAWLREVGYHDEENPEPDESQRPNERIYNDVLPSLPQLTLASLAVERLTPALTSIVAGMPTLKLAVLHVKQPVEGTVQKTAIASAARSVLRFRCAKRPFERKHLLISDRKWQLCQSDSDFGIWQMSNFTPRALSFQFDLTEFPAGGASQRDDIMRLLRQFWFPIV